MIVVHVPVQPRKEGCSYVRVLPALCCCIQIMTMTVLSYSPEINPDTLPPLPEIIADELRKQVFTHRSYHARPTAIFEDLPDDPSPDNEAYASSHHSPLQSDADTADIQP